MTSNVFEKFSSKYIPPLSHQNQSNMTGFNSTIHDYLSTDHENAKIMIMMAIGFWVGVIQVAMCFFNLGKVTMFLSEPLIKSFIFGCSFHVAISQLRHIFGIDLPAQTGLFGAPKVGT